MWARCSRRAWPATAGVGGVRARVTDSKINIEPALAVDTCPDTAEMPPSGRRVGPELAVNDRRIRVSAVRLSDAGGRPKLWLTNEHRRPAPAV